MMASNDFGLMCASAFRTASHTSPIRPTHFFVGLCLASNGLRLDLQSECQRFTRMRMAGHRSMLRVAGGRQHVSSGGFFKLLRGEAEAGCCCHSWH